MSPTTDREIEAGRFFDFWITSVATHAAAVNRKPSIRSRANRATCSSLDRCRELYDVPNSVVRAYLVNGEDSGENQFH